MAEETDRRSTVEKISTMLGDVVDLIGLGRQILGGIESLTSSRGGQKLLSEADSRASEIRSGRNQKKTEG